MKNYERWPQKPPISTEKGDFIVIWAFRWIVTARNPTAIIAAFFALGNTSILMLSR